MAVGGMIDRLEAEHKNDKGVWPPPEVRDHWTTIADYRRRYRNNKQEMINADPNIAVSQSKVEIFSPVPWPRELCRFSASLLFSEPPKVTSTEHRTNVDTLLEVNDFGAFAVRGGVKAAREGRVGIRVIRDTDVHADVPLLVIVHEDNVLWDIRHGSFVVGGVVIVERHAPDDKTCYYRLLEEHGPGWVERRLFKGERGRLGKRVAMGSIREFAGLAEEEETGLDRPTLIPWENIPGAESDLFGLGPLFDNMNEAESLMLDRGRKAIPRTFVHKSLADETGRLDIDGYILSGGSSRMMPTLGSTPGDLIHTVQPQLQAAEHIEWVNHSAQLLVTLAGYSPMTWSMQGKTANVTRAVSGYAMKLAQLRTLLTRSSKAHMALQALGWGTATCLAWMDGKKAVSDHLPTIELGDGLPNDPLDGAQEVLFLRQALAASTETLVKTVHPTWTPEEIDAEVARINSTAIFPPGGGGAQGVGPLGGRLKDLLDQADDDETAGDGTDIGAPGTD